MTGTDFFVRALVAHLIADWLLQNEYQALNKTSLRHPAAWLHAGIHLAALLVVLPPWRALLLAAVHLLIDTRVPLRWWQELIGQTREGPAAMHVAIWGDQVLHIACIALVTL